MEEGGSVVLGGRKAKYDAAARYLLCSYVGTRRGFLNLPFCALLVAVCCQTTTGAIHADTSLAGACCVSDLFPHLDCREAIVSLRLYGAPLF